MKQKKGNDEVLHLIQRAEKELCEKLLKLEIQRLDISDYNQRYLNRKLNAGIFGVMQMYGRILYDAVKNIDVPIQDMVIVDYGGGSGPMSLLAAEAGFGTVIYCDIYNVSCADIKKTAMALELDIDHIVCGDAEVLVPYLYDQQLKVDAIVSYDVLEHIYDVKAHFEIIGKIHGPFRILYGSGANIKNPFYTRRIKEKQIEAETRTKDKAWGHKVGNSLKAYVDIRREIIKAYASDLSEHDVLLLAKQTRGLIQSDIEQCVDEFINTGKVSYHIEHKTNTCDPLNGNWCEHLMDFEWLKSVVEHAGFAVTVRPGLYSTYGEFLKRTVRVFMNLYIACFKGRSMFIAPYYVVDAYKKD